MLGLVGGLLREVALLPLAPARGAGWVVAQVVAEAERQYYDPEAVRAALAALYERLEAGGIGEAEFERLEEELLDRLDEAAARGRS
ncbi:gas vesicle protein GvpG [Streptomyces sp. DSM 44917]|uniref:Gas vesicle protein GvpG n=1 Tax=Streptomyces boetiae TaxID=3075541 RepID=A0ABU2L2N5_9ACTN|nr:gas vesicle protein GvpG [Streptomyces sp. DSM 44917]MDT0305826.1 gas vesicle protein GvpG [Streptomyces sp. DSM 44917]